MTRALPALRASRADVVLVQHLEHAPADHSRVQRCEQEGEGQPGQDHVVGPVARPAAEIRALRIVTEVAVPGHREPPELDAEEPRRHEPEPDRVRAEAEKNEQHQAPVDQRSWSQRPQQPDREGDHQPEHQAAEHERGRDRERVADDRGHRLFRVHRLAEVPVQDDPLDEVDVPHHEGALRVVLRLQVRHEPRLALLEWPVVLRQNEKHHVRDQGENEREQHRSHQPPRHESEHQTLSLVSPPGQPKVRRPDCAIRGPRNQDVRRSECSCC